MINVHSCLSLLSIDACAWQNIYVLLSDITLKALADELIKFGEARPVTDKLKEILEPGDILFTRPKEIKKLHHKVFYSIESRIQNSPYTHVGLYVGDGKIIDAGSWTKRRETSTRVHEIPLETFTDRYKFKVLRVDATPSQKQEAVRFAKDQVGKDFNMSGMLRLALPFKGKQIGERERKKNAVNFFCSELVANAYNDVGIAKHKKLEHVMPGDISRSKKTRTVADFSS